MRVVKAIFQGLLDAKHSRLFFRFYKPNGASVQVPNDLGSDPRTRFTLVAAVQSANGLEIVFPDNGKQEFDVLSCAHGPASAPRRTRLALVEACGFGTRGRAQDQWLD